MSIDPSPPGQNSSSPVLRDKWSDSATVQSAGCFSLWCHLLTARSPNHAFYCRVVRCAPTTISFQVTRECWCTAPATESPPLDGPPLNAPGWRDHAQGLGVWSGALCFCGTCRLAGAWWAFLSALRPHWRWRMHGPSLILVKIYQAAWKVQPDGTRPFLYLDNLKTSDWLPGTVAARANAKMKAIPWKYGRGCGPMPPDIAWWVPNGYARRDYCANWRTDRRAQSERSLSSTDPVCDGHKTGKGFKLTQCGGHLGLNSPERRSRPFELGIHSFARCCVTDRCQQAQSVIWSARANRRQWTVAKWLALVTINEPRRVHHAQTNPHKTRQEDFLLRCSGGGYNESDTQAFALTLCFL